MVAERAAMASPRSQFGSRDVKRVMDWSRASDGELLAATRTDPDAFATFYDRYETAVVGYLLKRTHDAEISVDLAAEVFAAALRAAPRYREQKASAASWLFTIAQSKLTDTIRRGRVEARARRRLGIRDAVHYDTEDLDRIETLVSQSDWASELLARLPADQREAVSARILDERSYDEIARDLETSPLVVRKRVSRGLKSMRRSLEKPT
jgi:RNA polymerase sigma factor (sigma-70 family)